MGSFRETIKLRDVDTGLIYEMREKNIVLSLDESEMERRSSGGSGGSGSGGSGSGDGGGSGGGGGVLGMDEGMEDVVVDTQVEENWPENQSRSENVVRQIMERRKSRTSFTMEDLSEDDESKYA